MIEDKALYDLKNLKDRGIDLALKQKQNYLDIAKSDIGTSYDKWISTLGELIDKLSENTENKR